VSTEGDVGRNGVCWVVAVNGARARSGPSGGVTLGPLDPFATCIGRGWQTEIPTSKRPWRR